MWSCCFLFDKFETKPYEARAKYVTSLKDPVLIENIPAEITKFRNRMQSKIYQESVWTRK
jgi:hypothetical protein